MISIKKHRQYLPLILPALLVVGMFGFVRTDFFSSNQFFLSKALAFDLLIGIPVLSYFIIRNTEIPQKIVLQIFTLCLLVSTLIVPESNFMLMQVVKHVVYPIFKIWVGFRVIKKVLAIFKEYKVQANYRHGYELYTAIIKESFPGKFGEIVLMEFSLLYFLFKRKRTSSFRENEYTYSKSKGTVEMVSAFIFIVLIETIVVHVFIAKWSLIAAVLASYGSLYLIMLFISILRSRDHFPITIQGSKVYLKSGYVNESIVEVGDICGVELSSKSNIPQLMKLAAFKGAENHNVILHFRNQQTITKVFGVQQEYISIGVYVDEPKRFVDCLRGKMNESSTSEFF